MSTAAVEEQKLVLHISCHHNLKLDSTNCILCCPKWMITQGKEYLCYLGLLPFCVTR